MLKVALTGNIASGKSAVASVWRSLGARVIDADVLARRAVEPGTPALQRIVERWGSGMLDHSGALDRAALRDVVFRDPDERAELEAMVHPEVNRLRLAEMSAAEKAGERVVVADIPLLFEVGLEREFDLVVLVDAPEAIRTQRLIRNRGLDAAEAERMIAAQWPAQGKREAADIVIDNQGTLAELEEQASRTWQRLLAMREEGPNG